MRERPSPVTLIPESNPLIFGRWLRTSHTGSRDPWMKAGDSVQIAAETAHGGGEAGDAKTRVLVTYVVQKDKPLASPA
jgi:hypothetical protein